MMKTPVPKDLNGLTIRARKALNSSNFKFLEDLISSDLTGIKHCGVTTQAELRRWAEMRIEDSNAAQEAVDDSCMLHVRFTCHACGEELSCSPDRSPLKMPEGFVWAAVSVKPCASCIEKKTSRAEEIMKKFEQFRGLLK